MRIAFLSLALNGCALSCTAMFAPSLVEIDLEGEQPPGVYELEASSDGRSVMCAVTLPYADGDVISCTDWADVVIADDGQRVEAFVLQEFAPGSFVVEVSRDGEVVADETFEPDYAVDEPNGPGCGERSQATLTMAL